MRFGVLYLGFLELNDRRSKSNIWIYDLKKLALKLHLAEVLPDRKNKVHYFCGYENNFVISRDQTTLIGVEYDQKRKESSHSLVKLFNSHHWVRFGSNSRRVPTLLLVESLNCLLTGDGKGRVIQYILQGNRAQVVKDYGNLHIDWILASASFGHIAVFGGMKGKLVFIDVNSRTILEDPFSVSPQTIYSLKFFPLPKESHRILLTVSGNYYFDSCYTDCLDVTALFTTHQRLIAYDLSDKN